jgi:hypothetical protein
MKMKKVQVQTKRFEETVIVQGQLNCYLRLKVRRRKNETDDQLKRRALKLSAEKDSGWLVGGSIPRPETLKVTTLKGSP